jgi:hypothetical protein
MFDVFALDLPVAAAGVVAAVAQISEQISELGDWISGLAVPGGQIAITIAGLIGLVAVMQDKASIKTTALAMLTVLAIVVFIAAGDGAVREADQIGREIGSSVDGAPAANTTPAGDGQ